jgi:hypothetical protein
MLVDVYCRFLFPLRLSEGVRAHVQVGRGGKKDKNAERNVGGGAGGVVGKSGLKRQD